MCGYMHTLILCTFDSSTFMKMEKTGCIIGHCWNGCSKSRSDLLMLMTVSELLMIRTEFVMQLWLLICVQMHMYSWWHTCTYAWMHTHTHRTLHKPTSYHIESLLSHEMFCFAVRWGQMYICLSVRPKQNGCMCKISLHWPQEYVCQFV